MYADKGKLLSDIHYRFWNSDIPKILLFDDRKFDLLCENIQKYTYSNLIESFEHDEKIDFFLKSTPTFEQANKNIRTLEDAYSNGYIMPQTKEERIRCMWLSEKEFLEVIEIKRREKIEDDCIKASLSETLSRYKDKPFRQCTGDCGTCKREKCILES